MCLLGMKNFHVSSTGCRFPDEIRYLQRLLTSITYCLDSILGKFINNVGYDESKFHSSFREKLRCEKCISRLRCMCGVKYAGAYVGIGCLTGIIAATGLLVFRCSIVSNPDDVSLILKLFHQMLLDSLDSPLKHLIGMESDVTADHSLLEAVQFITTDNLADFNADIVISEVKEFMERYPTGYRLFDSRDQNQYSSLSR